MSVFPAKPVLNMNEIEFRSEGKPYERNGNHQCLWVAYLQAPTVADLFDEWVGSENWSDDYVALTFNPKGNSETVQAIECTISVRLSEQSAWVSKTDIGEFSNWAAVKGGYSDAFKRCGILKWGMGRVIYDLPQVWAECRVYGNGDNKKIGGETRDTQRTIQSKLLDAGFTGMNARVSAESVSGDDEHGETPDPTPKPAARGGKVAAPVTVAGEGSSETVIPAKPGKVVPPKPPVQVDGPPLDVTPHAAFSALGSAKNMAMKELKGDGLWPLGPLEGDYVLEALKVIARFAEAEGLAS